MKRLQTLLPARLFGRKSADAHREKKRRPELEQALLRVLIGFIVMVYLFWYAFRQPSATALTSIELQVLAVSVAFFVFCVGLVLRVLQKEGTSVPRRYL